MLTSDLGGGAELRPLEPWHAAEFAAYLDRSRAHLAPWLPWAEAITDEPSARAWLQGYAERQARDVGRIYGIWADQELVGGTLFRVFDVASGTCEIGVWLAERTQGRGWITRAVRHMIDWAFDARGMARVEWRTVPDNERSVAVAERLGMHLDGTLRSAMPLHGTRHDLQVWSLLPGDRA